MSDFSNLAVVSLGRGDLLEAQELARQAVREFPSEWHGYYALGQSLRLSGDFPGAIDALAHANQLAPRETDPLLALGIARQLNGDYRTAISAFREALEIDPDFVLAMNSLAMTQKLLGEYEKADHNCSLALKVLARSTVKRWHNSAENHRFCPRNSRFNIWAEYACFAAIWLAAEGATEAIALPTGEMALHDAKTGHFQGWYWNDTTDHEGKKVRLYCPNFFNSFYHELENGRIYKDLVGNRSTVLEKLGRTEEAEAHLNEAIDFSSPQELAATFARPDSRLPYSTFFWKVSAAAEGDIN